MTAALEDGGRRLERVLDLYSSGLSLRQVAGRVGVSHTTVRRLLEGAGVPIRQRHLLVVPNDPWPAQRALDVPPAEAAIAYSADRGWHIVQAPPTWFLELLADHA
jgi:transcriptional regulator with XRE-family HTH domain